MSDQRPWTQTNGKNKYKSVVITDHPKANTKGCVFVHIIKAESALGEELPINAIVHHADGNSLNNDNNNLVICQDHAYHMLLHQRMRAKKICGHASWRKCKICGEYDAPEKLYIHGENSYHRKCHAEYNKQFKKRICEGDKIKVHLYWGGKPRNISLYRQGSSGSEFYCYVCSHNFYDGEYKYRKSSLHLCESCAKKYEVKK